MPEKEKHFINKSNWLRAAVLGANDGIISISSLVIGVAAASTERHPIALAALAGLVAGALSMAAGEYVSVSSQCDIEKYDIKREREELEINPAMELEELKNIYVQRGLNNGLALQVAQELSRHNALEAHVRDELGINDITQANPLQAAFASGLSFVAGGILPFLVTLLAPVKHMVYFQYGLTIIFLSILGAVSAKTGGSKIVTAVLRVCFWGTVAMVITAVVGYLFGVNATL